MADKNNPGYNIVTLMKRLEAATSRLEDLTVYHATALGKAVGVSGSDKPAKSVTIETPPQLDSGSETKPTTAPTIDINTGNSAIAEFDDLLEIGKRLLALSQAIDPLVEEQVTHFVKAFEFEKDILKVSLRAAKPDPQSAEFVGLFKPIQEQADFIIELREKNRGSNFINHLATIAEGIPAIGWILVGHPIGYISDFKDSAQFYSNRILKEFRDTDKNQVTWVQEFSKFLAQLQVFVKKFYQAGLAWNPEGRPLVDVLEADKDKVKSPTSGPYSGPSGPSTSGVPPPPPMPPATVFKAEETPTSSGGMNAVFSELNKGEAITSGLRKVDKSQMTHKNPELREKKPIPAPPKKPSNLAGSKAAVAAFHKKKAARKELVDTKWIIENFENEHNIIIEAEMNQGVFIDHCINCTIQIKGKGSAVSISECTKTGVVVDSLVSGVDIIKNSGFGLQMTGVVPTLRIDQSNDGQIYLSNDSLDIKVYTAQTSSLNINIPKTEPGDYDEAPLAEQIVHRIENGKVVSEIVEHQD